MPRYFFHLRGSNGDSPDLEGSDLPDDERARTEAVSAAREMLAEKILRNEIVDGAVLKVVRSDGVLVGEILLRSAMRFE